jgi:hypothetical protein
MEQQGFERPDKTFYSNLLKGVEVSRQGFETQASFFKPRIRDSHLPPEITPNSGNAAWKIMMPTTTSPQIMPQPQGLLVVRERPLLVKKKRCTLTEFSSYHRNKQSD